MSAAPRRLALALVASILASTAAFVGSARAAEVGVNSDVSWGLSAGDIDRSVTMMDQQGVRWARVAVSWKSVEPNSKGVYSSGYLSSIDSIVSKLHSAGIEIEMLFDTVPYWASADPNKHLSGSQKVWDPYYRPASYQDYADAARQIAQRYSAKGVHVFEVWNEPNLSRFWPSGTNAGEYAKMLKAAYPAIKSVAPGATVIGGGLSQNDHKFLQGIYAAGGGDHFDAFATHSYPKGDPNNCWNDSSGHRHKDAFCSIEEIRRVMVANGDSAKDIWLDEFGWSTCSNSYNGCWGKGVSESRQAEYLTAAFQKLETYPYVKAALVYNFRNTYFRNEDPGDWNGNLGLLHIDFSPKPAYRAVADYAHGVTAGVPSVQLTSPADGSQFDKSLAIAADVFGDWQVTGVKLWIDDRLLSTDTTAPYGYTWKVPKKFAHGAHTVKAQAYDATGRVATDTVSVTRSRNVTLRVARSKKKAGAALFRAHGRVSGARRGRVSIKLQRKASDGWVTVTSKRPRLARGGRYRSSLGTLRDSRGWRARASYKPGRRHQASHSKYRYFGAG